MARSQGVYKPICGSERHIPYSGIQRDCAGRPVALKVDSRTIIAEQAERAWQRALPKLIPRAARATKRRAQSPESNPDPG
jgi:hypothetical protein